MKLGAATALTFSLGFWREALAEPAVVGRGPYGRLRPADALGVRLPEGFQTRLLGVTGQVVDGTTFEWVGAPDGAATFATEDGGWIYAANSEIASGKGGVAAIRFDASGDIVDAYRILSGTRRNCSGGSTAWGTWLSGEEVTGGHVWECDPHNPSEGVERPLLGTFSHEAAVVDPTTGYVYLTEDNSFGRFYRFRPTTYGDLSTGVFEAAKMNRAKTKLSWVAVSSDEPERSAATTSFKRGEGAWFSGKHVYFCTTGDNRVWAFNPETSAIEIIYDAALLGADAPLHQPDAITAHAPSGDLFVGEDADNLEVVLLAKRPGKRVAAPFLRLIGHGGSELTGLAFSPDGTRLYCSSQRGTDGTHGITFEITGPFRT